MVNYFPCWKLELMSDSDAKVYFGKRPRFKGTGVGCQLRLTMENIQSDSKTRPGIQTLTPNPNSPQRHS